MVISIWSCIFVWVTHASRTCSIREIIPEFRDRLDARNQQTVSGARAGDVQKMTLGIVDIVYAGRLRALFCWRTNLDFAVFSLLLGFRPLPIQRSMVAPQRTN